MAPGPGSDCVIVDPGFGVSPGVRDVLAAERLRPAAVLLTHGHVDHVWSVVPVCATADPPPAVHIHADDAYRLVDPTSAVDPRLVAMIAAQFPTEAAWAAPADVVAFTGAGGSITVAGMVFDVTHTPGHTEGSVVFGLDGNVRGGGDRVMLSGDVLFAGSVGRTDLAGGDPAAMLVSLGLVMSHDDDTTVLPGHGAATTIGAERRANPFVRAALVAPGAGR